MSYEVEMMLKFKMPERSDVEEATLVALFNSNGVLKEFSELQDIVDKIALHFKLNSEQKRANLETIYKKENRVKRSSLWHRLLFRAADRLANASYISRPKDTFLVTNNREWVLTEKGYNKVLALKNMKKAQKEVLRIKSLEVETTSKEMQNAKCPDNYSPFEPKPSEKISHVKKSIRKRCFRQAILEAYGHKCSVCGFKLYSPDMKIWEVQAAHIIPSGNYGKDDIWNGLSLCHTHHWAFDVGWFTILSNFMIKLSSKIDRLNDNFGKIFNSEILRNLENRKLQLPENENNFPHESVISWHKENVFIK